MMTEIRQNGIRGRWGLLLVVNAGFLFWCQTAHCQINELRGEQQSAYQPVIGQPSSVALPSVGDEIISTPSAAKPFSLYPDPSRVSQSRSEMPAATHPDLSSIISRLAVSTLIVLGLCVGSLLLYRKFRMNGFGSAVARPASTTGPEIRVEAMLRLRGNRCLEIVRADNARLVIVSDGNGVKSVLPIGTRFEEQIRKCQTGERKADVDEALFEAPSLDPTARDWGSVTRL